MNRVVLVAALALLLATPAVAGDDVMAGFYGNTVISTSQMGESHTHYKADHTFDSSLTGGMGSFTATGTWSVDDKGQLCRTYDKPPPGLPNPFCLPIEAHKTGDSWTITFNGQSVPVAMKAGIE
jgi:opacity protein-like surface antigen